MRASAPRPKAARQADAPAGQAASAARPGPSPLAVPKLQRACACGGTCPKCRAEADAEHASAMLAPANDAARPAMAPAGALRALSDPGQGLDTATRAALEPRLGDDLGDVRLHTGAEAGEAARGLGALAYTIGRDIAFAPGAYRPESAEGRRLLAHELTHTVQQRGVARPTPDARIPVDPTDSPAEREARSLGAESAGRPTPAAGARLSKADPDAVSRVAAVGRSEGTGLQLVPNIITDTVVGPPPRGGGLLGDRQERLNVIVGENLTPRLLARALLPLYITATPFQAGPGAAPVPLQIIDEDTLARGILVYNQTYLMLPAMTRWQAGLRLPLPIGIDAGTGVATLHPTVVADMAAGFDPTFAPALDQRAGGLPAPSAARTTAEAGQFLIDNPTPLARGYALAARAIANARAERPFVDEVLSRAGAGAFFVALEFMNALVNRQVAILAAQTDGTFILFAVELALGAPPGALDADQQAALDRANLMLGLGRAIPAVAPPGAMRTQPERTVTIDMLKLDGSTHNPATDLAVANAIYAQCNVRLIPGVNQTATPADSLLWLGPDLELQSSPNCGSINAEERRLLQTGRAQHGLGGGDFMVYFIRNTQGSAAGGLTCDGTAGVHPFNRRVSLVHNSGDTDSLAHELGHHLITRAQSDAHNSPGSPMQGRPRTTLTFSPIECTQIYGAARP